MNYSFINIYLFLYDECVIKIWNKIINRIWIECLDHYYFDFSFPKIPNL